MEQNSLDTVSFSAFISMIGHLKSRQETGGREREWHAAKGHRRYWICGCCGEDTVSVCRTPALPTEPLGTPQCTFFPAPPFHLDMDSSGSSKKQTGNQHQHHGCSVQYLILSLWVGLSHYTSTFIGVYTPKANLFFCAMKLHTKSMAWQEIAFWVATESPRIFVRGGDFRVYCVFAQVQNIQLQRNICLATANQHLGFTSML